MPFLQHYIHYIAIGTNVTSLDAYQTRERVWKEDRQRLSGGNYRVKGPK